MISNKLEHSSILFVKSCFLVVSCSARLAMSSILALARSRTFSSSIIASLGTGGAAHGDRLWHWMDGKGDPARP